jgi:hypothetical protein
MQNTVGSVHEEMSPAAEVAYLANQEDQEASKLQAIRKILGSLVGALSLSGLRSW